jgi:hypothetical protein
MASQLGIEADRFPITPQLVFDLVFGFGVFNQFLLVLLSRALGHDGRPILADRCMAGSAALGALLYAAALAWQWTRKWMRPSDAIVYALLSAPLAGGVVVAVSLHRIDAALAAAAANLLLLVWQSRGFLRRRWAKLRQG